MTQYMKFFEYVRIEEDRKAKKQRFTITKAMFLVYER